MNLYQSIMAAADQIENDPASFVFSISVVPECGSPGCALGWIGAFAGCASGTPIKAIASLLGIPPESASATLTHDSEGVFYQRMNALSSPEDPLPGLWMLRASLCARNLRAYARKYHAPRTDAELVKALLKKVYSEVFEESGATPDRLETA